MHAVGVCPNTRVLTSIQINPQIQDNIMPKMLIIAEKPSVAEDIAKAVGGFTRSGDWFGRGDAIIAAAAGHLAKVVAPGSDKAGKTLESLPFIPTKFAVAVSEDPRSITRFKMLEKLMARPDVTGIVNACDAGREGELIFRLIYEAAKCHKPCKRMWLKSMTPQAINASFHDMEPAEKYDRLADAARCRSEADWLIGINGSRGVTCLHQVLRGTYQSNSAGRVQTPTLAILVDLEDKIRNFKPVDYFEVHATFAAAAGDYVGRWYSPGSAAAAAGGGAQDYKESSGYRMNKKEQADAIAAKCRGATATSVKDDTKAESQGAPKLFDLTTLQREVNKRYKLSAADTLKVAQSLYEKKVTTYPRTDASALPEDYVDTARETLLSFAGSGYGSFSRAAVDNGWVKPNKKIFDNTKISDHFAIIPTGLVPSGLSEVEMRVYDMIVRRFIAAFYPPAEYLQTTRITTVCGEQFRSSGRVLKSEGWKAVYGTVGDSDGKVPALVPVGAGERPATKSIVVKAEKTKPPKRLSDATLLSAMEHAGKLLDDAELSEAMAERGLGTPATRAATIEGLLSTVGGAGKVKEPYLVRDTAKNELIPSEKGMGLIHFLREIGVAALTSPAMTGEWEHKLLLMSKGKYQRQTFMAEIEQATKDMLDAIRVKAPALDAVPINCPCPQCKGQVKGGYTSYACQSACGFEVRRQLCGRPITAAEVEQLISTGATGPLEGFISAKSGNQFGASLKFGPDFKLDFVFVPRNSDDPAALQAAPALEHKCPKCNGVMKAGASTFQCENGDFSFRRTVAGRKMIDVEADYLLAHKKTPRCGGFMSTKTNKMFEAAYKLNQDLEVELVFEKGPR